MSISNLLNSRTKVGIIFSGGPAPAANAVISAAALSFLDNSIHVLGIYNGYKHLIDFDKKNPHLKVNEHYTVLDSHIGDIRNRRGVYIKTARANPGKDIKNNNDLADPNKIKRLNNVLDAFEYLDVGLLISIGGDDTLRTGNLLQSLGMPVIHVPKTIDNDYFGIPWTFGYWTSADIAQKALLNLQSDSESTGSYFIAEIMGRKAGWLTFAAGIAGEAIKMYAVEDLPPEGDIDVDGICNDIVDTILV
ncbi:MAG: 6-phosphofructokinase, partial [Spirochaetota bacterium]|nr:6-phosphofructokinase [Spirochaetota bacterium]